MTIKTGLLGVSGYTGQVLLNLLLDHPVFDIKRIFSTSFEGPIEKLHSNMFDTRCPDVQTFDITICEELDLIFLAVPHTKAMPIVRDLNRRFPLLKIVDLSADFRLKDASLYEVSYNVIHEAKDLLSSSIYGLPEKYKADLKQANLIANPGCYATSMILGLLPLKGVIDSQTPIVIDAKSGVSGAGRSLKQTSLFCEVNESLSAYSTGTHRHLTELIQETEFTNVIFSPHLVPMSIGIESAIYFKSDQFSESSLMTLFSDYYQDHPFVKVLDSSFDANTNMVAGNNHCVLIPKMTNDWVVIFSLIDNLMKGASGQAIQNANLMFGLDETLGLV